MKAFKASVGFFVFLALSLPFAAAHAAVEHEKTSRGFTNKSTHGDDEHNFYKRPNTGSFTGPFDYGTQSLREEPMEAPAPTGKCNCFTFDGTKSFDPDRQKLTYDWDFGDGQKGTDAVMRHCYDKAGNYDVTLTVRDESGEICGNGVTMAKVEANFPPTAKAGDPQEACLGEAITFDGSGSSASSSDATYAWDFGDGQKGDGKTVSHTYEKAGAYNVRLVVNDGKNTECSVAQDVTRAVVTDKARVSLAEARSACAGENVHFSADGNMSKYSWDFGDGTKWEGGSGAAHSYEKSGTYTVRVTGDTGRGGDCAVASDSTSVVISAPPVAKAGDNLVCCVDKETAFDASGSTGEGPLSYHWDFGDGQSADGERVTHAYSKPGNYRVVLTVKDGSGSACDTASDSFTAVVNAKPEAVIQVR